MDAYSSKFSVFWILISLSSTCKSQTECFSDNFELFTCCYNYSVPGSEVFHVKCPQASSAIDVVAIIHLYGSDMCSAGYIQHTCNISNLNMAWRSSGVNGHLSYETCLNSSNDCTFEIQSVQTHNVCNGATISDWTDVVIVSFKCIKGLDDNLSISYTTSTNLDSTNDVVTTPKRNAPNSTPNNQPTGTSHSDDDASTSRHYDYPYSSVVTSDSSSESLPSTTLESGGNMTETPGPAAQQSSVAGTIGGSITAVVVAIVIVIIIIFLVRRRKLQEKQTNFDNEKSNSNEHTYTDVDYSKTSPHKSKYEEANATQEKDFPLKHCDSHETSHYCYVDRNECHGKGHTNDEEKPQYDNVENMTYDTPKTNRVDNQDQNHYDNINEEVENKNNERIDLYAVPNKAKTGVSGDNNKMSLKRNMDGSEYSIYPTLPAKCFDTLAEDPDRPKYAEIDMEKSGISASSRKNVDAKPSEDLNYAQIQF